MSNIHLKYDSNTPLLNNQILRFYISGVTSGVSQSIIYDNGTNIGIGTITPTDKLSIYTAKTATSTATPDSINLGGTFSNAAGTNLKFKIYDDGGSIGGFGISSGQLDYKTWSTGADHVFYADTTKIVTMKGTGEVGIGTAAPSARLHAKGVDNTSGNFGLKIVDSGDTLLSYVRNDGYAAFDRYLRVGLRGDYGQLDIYGYTDPSSEILNIKNKNEQTIFNFRQESYNPYLRLYSNGSTASTIGIDGAPNLMVKVILKNF